MNLVSFTACDCAEKMLRKMLEGEFGCDLADRKPLLRGEVGLERGGGRGAATRAWVDGLAVLMAPCLVCSCSLGHNLHVQGAVEAAAGLVWQAVRSSSTLGLGYTLSG